jgi:uncharacterized protein (DUF1499 family)
MPLRLLVVMLAASAALADPTPALAQTSVQPMTNTLQPCPSSPNCVSSQASDPAQRVEPLAFSGDPAAAQARLTRALQQMRGMSLVEQRPGWIAAEFRSRVFRFVDDVHLSLDPAASVFHVRSASRTGYSDLGVNRKRVEELRTRFSGG